MSDAKVKILNDEGKPVEFLVDDLKIIHSNFRCHVENNDDGTYTHTWCAPDPSDEILDSEFLL